MYQTDLRHPLPSLEDKLHRLYNLKPGQRLELSFRKPYLDLLEKFGNPHKNLPPVIHIAGTNGKGSTLALLHAMLETQGLKAHAYTSPHLLRFNERIVLAGTPIEDAPLESLIDEALALNAGAENSFFEITTAMAFAAFSRTPADVLLLETGLGGRLDCTNVVESPAATIITPIGLDHMQYLGDSLEKIAVEKAEIMKQGAPCVIAPQTKEAQVAGIMHIFSTKAQTLNIPLFRHDHEWHLQKRTEGFEWSCGAEKHVFPAPSLPGAHQIENAATALTTLHALRHLLKWDKTTIRKGLQNTCWPGRLQRIENTDPKTEIWLDGGHNENAARALAAQLQNWRAQDDKPLHLIVGMKNDKNPHSFLEPLRPFCTTLNLVDIPGTGGCIRPADIDPALPFYPDVRAALGALPPEGEKRVLICGSLYLASQIL